MVIPSQAGAADGVQILPQGRPARAWMSSVARPAAGRGVHES